MGAEDTFNSWKAPRLSVDPQRMAEGWVLDLTGPKNKWVHPQRSGDLHNGEDICSGFTWDVTEQVTTEDVGGATFYRVRVP